MQINIKNPTWYWNAAAEGISGESWIARADSVMVDHRAGSVGSARSGAWVPALLVDAR